jgi:hypothetical protein
MLPLKLPRDLDHVLDVILEVIIASLLFTKISSEELKYDLVASYLELQNRLKSRFRKG